MASRVLDVRSKLLLGLAQLAALAATVLGVLVLVEGDDRRQVQVPATRGSGTVAALVGPSDTVKMYELAAAIAAGTCVACALLLRVTGFASAAARHEAASQAFASLVHLLERTVARQLTEEVLHASDQFEPEPVPFEVAIETLQGWESQLQLSSPEPPRISAKATRTMRPGWCEILLPLRFKP